MRNRFYSPPTVKLLKILENNNDGCRVILISWGEKGVELFKILKVNQVILITHFFNNFKIQNLYFNIINSLLKFRFLRY